LNVVFADTFYWIALTNVQDLAHERVKAFTQYERPGLIVTTDEVLTEYLNYFASWGSHFRAKATQNVQNILANSAVRVVSQNPESFRVGFDLYRSRLDKGYSLTDCISMQTMRKQGITNALTNDAHFEQEGYIAVFRESRRT
jgi:hypothetical protein